MISERKKISIKHLKIGDMVVGLHVDKPKTFYKIVAGKITNKTTAKDGLVTYHVMDHSLCYNSEKTTANLSGGLDENEVEVIDPDVCNTIIELYEVANKQLDLGLRSAHETAEKAHEMRHTSRAELEEKYTVGAQ
ncbi:MAG: hypothetical protein ABII39_04980 [Candidatus Micrarchaeota archaeon]